MCNYLDIATHLLGESRIRAEGTPTKVYRYVKYSSSDCHGGIKFLGLMTIR